MVNGNLSLQMRTPRPRGRRGTIRGPTGLRLGPRSLTPLLRCLLCMAPPLGRGTPPSASRTWRYRPPLPCPGNLAASGPRLDLRPRVHCRRRGHYAAVPEEAVRGPEDPGVHVHPLSHPLHLHQDFGEYPLRCGCPTPLKTPSAGRGVLPAGQKAQETGSVNPQTFTRAPTSTGSPELNSTCLFSE